MNNLIGYSPDTTKVMFGKHNSVSKLLITENSNLTAVKCYCHLICLVSSYGALNLPKEEEDLYRYILNHFHCSSKRQGLHQQFQKFFNTEPHKILSASQTRCLSLMACVNRILKQYHAFLQCLPLVATLRPTLIF